MAGEGDLGAVLQTTMPREKIALGELTHELAPLVAQLDGAAAHDIQGRQVRIVRRKGGAPAEVTHRELPGQVLEHLVGKQIEGVVANEKIAD